MLPDELDRLNLPQAFSKAAGHLGVTINHGRHNQTIDNASLLKMVGLECEILNPGGQDLYGGNRPPIKVVRDANSAYKTILMSSSPGYYVSFVMTTSHNSK